MKKYSLSKQNEYFAELVALSLGQKVPLQCSSNAKTYKVALLLQPFFLLADLFKNVPISLFGLAFE